MKSCREPSDPFLLATEEKTGENQPKTIKISKILDNIYLITLIDAIQ
jgi:hypothetical protein